MKCRIIFFAFLCFIHIQLAAQAPSGMPNKITLGLYSAGGTTAINNNIQYLNYINDLGIDAAIHYVNSTVNPLLSNLDLISQNNSAQDYVFSYSQGYYSKWEAENIVSTQNVGFRQAGGIYPSTTWKNNYNSNAKLFGPRYEQEKKYREHSPLGGHAVFVPYIAKVKIRLTEFETPGNVCSIEIKYFWDKNKDKLVGENEFDIIRTIEIFTTDTITTNWIVLELDYHYNHAGIETIPNNDFTEENDYGPGVQIEINSLSNIGFEVDYVEFVDNSIWENYFVDEPVAFQTNLTSYITNSIFQDIKYFYSQDEPHLFDQYVPFNTVKNAIDGYNGYKPLFTTFYPQWNRQYCGEPTFPLIDKFNSEQILFYYYPVISVHNQWNDSNYTYTEPICPTPYAYLDFAMRHLEDATTTFPDKNLWFTMQVHGHRNDNANVLLRSPSTKEVNVQAMIALAHGMKGIFFYNMQSYGDPLGIRYNIGLVTRDDDPIDPLEPNYKYYLLKNNLIPRIKNKYEKHLINLKYNNVFDKYFYIDPAIRYVNSNGYTHNNPNIALKLINFNIDPNPSRHVLVTQLDNNVNPNESIYYSVVNLITSETFKPSQHIGYSYTIPQVFNSFRNIRFRDIEDQFDLTFDNSSQSTKNYNHSLLPGAGVFIQTGPVLKIGGTLKFNETISQDIFITNDIIVEDGVTLTIEAGKYLIIPNGVTLTIESGAKLEFNENSNLFVFGNLIAEGTPTNKITLERAGSSGQWGTITFDGSETSGSILNHIEMKNGTEIQCLNGADITIQNSLFQDCGQAVYIYNSAPKIINNVIDDPIHNGIFGEANGKSPLILGNTFIRTSGRTHKAIHLGNYTSPFIANNDISGFDHGMYLGGGTYAYFSDNYHSTPNPNNRMRNCNRGLIVGWGGTVKAGIEVSYSFFEYNANSIYNNIYEDVYVYRNSSVFAEGNWWGGGSPITYVQTGSFLIISTPLPVDPWLGIPKQITQQSGVPETQKTPVHLLDIQAGSLLEMGGKIDEAIIHYQGMIERNSAPTAAIAALLSINNNNPKAAISNFLSTRSAVGGDLKPKLLSATASIYLQEDDYEKAILTYDKIINDYSKSYDGISARFDKLFAALHYKNNRTLAQEILSEIKSLDITDDELLARKDIANRLLNSASTAYSKSNNGTGQAVVENIETPKTYEMQGNYPNPFNPSTTISFALPFESTVSLEIYDITGKLIQSFDIPNKSAGYHNVLWNGKNSNYLDVASGVYLYRFTAASLENKEVFSKSDKMMLIR
jgi:tetratricopeptide (TPR) repeat protein